MPKIQILLLPKKNNDRKECAHVCVGLDAELKYNLKNMNYPNEKKKNQWFNILNCYLMTYIEQKNTRICNH